MALQFENQMKMEYLQTRIQNLGQTLTNMFQWMANPKVKALKKEIKLLKQQSLAMLLGTNQQNEEIEKLRIELAKLKIGKS